MKCCTDLPIDNVLAVQIAEGAGNLGGVELGALLREDVLPREMEKELPTVDVLHDKEDVIARREGVLQLGHEGMVVLLEDPVLCLRVAHLFFLREKVNDNQVLRLLKSTGRLDTFKRQRLRTTRVYLVTCH